MTARPGVSCGDHQATRQLMFHVEVKLLHSTLFEVEVLGLNGSLESSRVRFGCEGWGKGLREAATRRDCSQGTDSSREVGSFGEEWRILPQTLSALVPGRIVEDGIASANGCVLAAKRLPGKTDTRLECSLVHLDTDSTVGVHSGDQIVAARRRSTLAVEIKVSLAIFGLGDRSHQRVSEPQIQG